MDNKMTCSTYLMNIWTLCSSLTPAKAPIRAR